MRKPFLFSNHGDFGAAGAILVTLLVSRACLLWLGIGPEPSTLGWFWQNLPLDQLNADLGRSLERLHSQPPLWNLVLGLAAKSCDGDAQCVANRLWIGNVAASGVAAFLMFRILRRLGLTPSAATVSACLFLISPAAVYYENFLNYAQFTYLMYAVIAYCLMEEFYGAGRIAVAAALGAASALALTWTLFNPLFVVVVFVACALIDRGAALRPFGIAAFVLALALALAPSFSNQAAVGIFANGSWAGLNLAQVAPSMTTDERSRCSFSQALADPVIVAPEALPAETLNRPEVASLSKDCLRIAVGRIFDNPVSYALGAAIRLVVSLSTPPSHYLFPPNGWETIDPYRGMRTHDDPSPLTYSEIAFRGATFGYYLLAGVIAIVFAKTTRRREARGWIVASLTLAAWVLVFSHAFNGGEQQRMRFTTEFLFWIYICLGAYALIRKTSAGLRAGVAERARARPA